MFNVRSVTNQTTAPQVHVHRIDEQVNQHRSFCTIEREIYTVLPKEFDGLFFVIKITRQSTQRMERHHGTPAHPASTSLFYAFSSILSIYAFQFFFVCR